MSASNLPTFSKEACAELAIYTDVRTLQPTRLVDVLTRRTSFKGPWMQALWSFDLP